MEYKIHYSPQALADLDSIRAYIAGTLENGIAAAHTIKGILDRVETLAQFPESGAPLFILDGLPTGYRSVLYRNYRVFYHIERDQVRIDRVLNGRMDHMRLLFPDEERPAP